MKQKECRSNESWFLLVLSLFKGYRWALLKWEIIDLQYFLALVQLGNLYIFKHFDGCLLGTERILYLHTFSAVQVFQHGSIIHKNNFKATEQLIINYKIEGKSEFNSKKTLLCFYDA